MMQRSYPFQALRQMQDTMDRMRRRYGDPSGRVADSSETEAWAVPLDVFRNGDDTVIRASMPGVKPEDIQVSIEDNVLTIKGQSAQEHGETDGAYIRRECRSGSFQRSVRLPDYVDPDQVQPNYNNGFLTITVPKAEAKRARQLQVRVVDSEQVQDA